ncbi:YnbE family lipoprotein [Novosphingobium sp. PhB165]|uniref:YnbE family lipoprotein n=1 Tax=Novosphingobium sp. PhB165 TaxID=2485105 RepID=UPI001FB2674C|nr:YnbE family lipoprotein [Novosphingobium sp. PhB165]
MTRFASPFPQRTARRTGRRAVRAATMMTGLIPMLSGCIQVTAPDKPIVIELNVNIRQEVIYQLSADAEKTIQDNEGVF